MQTKVCHKVLVVFTLFSKTKSFHISGHKKGITDCLKSVGKLSLTFGKHVR